jgi:hypothetical protein
MNVFTGAWLGSSYSSNGKIDNVSFLPGALTAAQVAILYSNGRNGAPTIVPKESSLVVTGIDTAQGYILDVNSNIVDDSAGLSCSPSSASFIVAPSRGINNDSDIFRSEGIGLDRTQGVIDRKYGTISNLSALSDRVTTTTVTDSLTIQYFQRVWDVDNSQWCYYTKTSIDSLPAKTETTPANSGNIVSSSVVRILDIS